MPPFRIAIGRITHESNSFFREGTPLQAFASFGDGLMLGADLLDKPERRDEVTGFLDVFRRSGPVEAVPLLSTTTPPSGLVTDDAAKALEDILRRQLRQAGPVDGVCVSLHGAMSGETIADLDGHFLQVIREETGPDIPVVCSLDCHAVVTRQMIELCTALTAYRTHPHTDLVETGARAATILLDVLSGETRPVMRCCKMPVLFGDSGTITEPLGGLFRELAGWDRNEGVIACSLCPAYPYQDVPEQGWTAVAVTDGDEELADRLARQLAGKVWNARHELLPAPMLSPEEAMAEAANTPGYPIVITDSADNVGAGAPGDTPAILRAVLERRAAADGLVLIHIPDAAAVAATKTAKPGDTVCVEVGGKRDPRFGTPVPVSGKLLCVTEGSITDDGRFGDLPTIDVGRIVCLAIDNVRLVLTEKVIQGPQPSLFRKLGIEPFDAKIVVVKSGIGYEVTYGPVAEAIIHADCPGAGARNLGHFTFERVPRPIFPLDPELEWQPEV